MNDLHSSDCCEERLVIQVIHCHRTDSWRVTSVVVPHQASFFDECEHVTEVVCDTADDVYGRLKVLGVVARAFATTRV